MVVVDGGAARLMSSWSPWAKRQRSPYLQLPVSLKFLHISYLRRTIAFTDEVETDFESWTAGVAVASAF